MLSRFRIGVRITAGFLVPLVLLVGIGAYAVVSVETTAEATDRMHRHPFTVLTSLGDFRGKVYDLHVQISDRLSGEAAGDNKDVMTLLGDAEGSFRLAADRYLGPKQDFSAAAEAFRAWGKSVERAQKLQSDHRSQEASALYRGQGRAEFVTMLNSTDAVTNFARGKAESFVKGSREAKTTLEIVIAFVVGGALLVGTVISFLIGRSVTRPLSAVTSTMAALSKGDLSLEIPGLDRGDEIGEVARSTRIFKESMAESQTLREEQEKSKARAEAEKKAALREMADAFEQSVQGVIQTLTSTSQDLQSSAELMKSTAEENSRQAVAVSSASVQASTNVQTVASAAEELSSSVAEINRQVAQSNRITTEAVEQTQLTDHAVTGLSAGAQKIGDVVQLINDIAGQTNLLALNATIEAARAGEAGRGFAVVASEVKNLANQTARATDEITAQISAMQAATQDSVRAIQAIGRTIGQVNEISTTIAAAVEEQGAATREIARNVQEAAEGTREVTDNIGAVTKASEETRTTATQVFEAASALSTQAEQLRHQVDRFLNTVRAA